MEQHVPPRLTVVVPVFNEERTLVSLMQRLIAACPFAELIFVDDGSTDQSHTLLLAHARPQDLVLTKPNAGKGSAVRLGYAHAHGRYIIVQDADLEYSPEEIPALLAFAESHDYPAVFGSRRLKRQKQFVHLSTFVGGSLLTYLCNVLYGSHLTDQPTCYKLVRADTLQMFPLKEDDFRFDPELTVQLLRYGIPIREFPVSYHPRTKAEGKKINWRDWFKWVWVFLTFRVMPRGQLSALRSPHPPN